MTAQKSKTSETFTNTAAASGWGASADLPPGECEVVPVWLYSHSYHTGSRLVSQLLKEVYENGLPDEYLSQRPGNAGDALNAEIKRFDQLPPNRREEAHQSLTGGMVHYALNSKLWKMLPHCSQAPGIHLVQVDWHSTHTHVIQQAVCIQSTPLTPQEISAICKQTIEAHVARHPYDKPVTRRAH